MIVLFAGCEEIQMFCADRHFIHDFFAFCKEGLQRKGQGRSGGYRFLIAYHSGKRAVFLYGFAKSERDNIEADELETLREIGTAWHEAKNDRLEYAI
jgi:hypothetical protein